MKRFLFVTGTGTGVGKTTISVALLAAWQKRGFLVRPCKPIETGLDAESTHSDACRLASAAGFSIGEVSFLRFRLAASPETAALAERDPISFDRLVEHCRSLPSENILIEGAGGLLVPITAGRVMADLAQGLDARVLVVAATHLGTVNHSLLTLFELARRKLPVAGLVLNQVTSNPGPEEADVPRLLREHAVPDSFDPHGPLCTFPFVSDQTPETLAKLAEKHLSVAKLFQACFPSNSTNPRAEIPAF